MKKEVFRKILNPPAWVIIVSDIVVTGMLIFALGFPEAAGWFAYVAYLVSAFALVVTIIGVGRLFRYIKMLIAQDRFPPFRWLKRLMHTNGFTARYFDDKDFRAEVSLYTGLAINMLYGVFKGATGVLYASPWLWSMGIYFFAVGGIRFMLMRSLGRKNFSQDEKAVKLHEYRTYRRCGIMMLFMNITVAGLAIQMIWQNKANEYSRVVVIITACYTFYSFILALVNVVSFRTRDNAILSAAKDLTFSGAVMSMLTLQTSMLYAFNEKGDDYRRLFNSITGGFVITIVVGISVYMIIRGTRKIKVYIECIFNISATISKHFCNISPL
ncbi:MAG: hypothetical protein IK093_01920 [Ruminiclostridium sp.]|nr:hypothetical protein [Ruminiclostridium sp.]